MLETFQVVFGSMLKFLVEWMTAQSLQLFPLDGSFAFTSALQSVLFSISLIGVFYIAPKKILRPMFCTLSILLLSAFEAVIQVVET